MADGCECGNEPSGSVKCGEFLNWLQTVRCSRRTLHRGVRKAQDGGKVVSLTHRPRLPPGNTPGTHFC